MRMTAKYVAARNVVRSGKVKADLNSKDQSDLYDQLEKAGWYWNSQAGEWENLKCSSTMFENDDGLWIGVVRIRLMAHPGDMAQFSEIIREALDTYGITIQEVSNPYPNRRGAGLRIYITGVLPKGKPSDE